MLCRLHIVILLLLAVNTLAMSRYPESQKVRKPAVAGTFYPASTRAANIDIKAMDDAFYRKWCGASLAQVLENILTMHGAGIHVEITNLLVTGLNDSEGQVAALCRWMVENGLRDVPLHLSRFFPRYHFTDVGPTPKATLLMARDVALSHGIRTVHLGNISPFLALEGSL